MEKDNAVILKLLDKSHLFKSLDEEGRSKLAELALMTKLPTGETVIEEGSEGDRFFLLLKGEVSVTSRKGDELVELARLGVGAVLGEVALLTGEPRTASVIAKQDVVLVEFPEPGINDILEDYPKVKELLVRVLVHRAKDTIEKMSKDQSVS